MTIQLGRKSRIGEFEQPDDQSISLEKSTVKETTSVPLSWLTVEMVLYGCIFLLAFGLRFWQLGSYPLSNAEAEQSLVAWQIYQGQSPPPGDYSPLLVSLNTFLFFLFGASDATARLSTLLLGMLLVMLPMTLRRQFGDKTCLIASLLLAISPSALYLSRTLNSEIGVAVGSLMIVAGFFNWAADMRTTNQHWLWLLATGGAILLTGALSYSVILVFGLLILIGLGMFFGLSTEKAILWTERLGTNNPLPLFDEDQLVDELSIQNEKTNQPNWQQIGLTFVVTLLMIATTATLNLTGFSVLTNMPSSWLSYFSLSTTAEAGFNAVFLLVMYEPILIIFGLVGLAYAMLRNDLLGLALGGWFVGLLLLDVMMGGRPLGAVILPLIPLTFLAASVLAWLWDSLERHGSWQNEGILATTGLIIAIFGYIGLTGWIVRGCAADDLFCEYAWLQPLAALTLFLTISGLFVYLSENVNVGLRGIGLTMLSVTLLFTLNGGTRMNYGPLENLAYHPLTGLPVSTGFAELVETITRQSNDRAFGNNLIDIVQVDIDSPALQWQLRDFPNITKVSTITEIPTATLIITHPDDTRPAALGESYIGQSFGVDAIWSPIQLRGKDLISWLIYHKVEERPQSNQVVLWVRM